MKLLVFRFSAMGDVALTVPVLRGVLNQNPDLEITLVTNAGFAPLFNDFERLTLYGVRFKDYNGLFGLRRLYTELKELQNWDAVIDLHSVMRSWILNKFFKLSGVPVFGIDKGRKEKAALVRKSNKVFKQLKHTAERYLDVFRAFGLKAELEEGPVIRPTHNAREQLRTFFETNGIKKDGLWVGLAPFSKHKQKTWPYGRITELIEILGKEESCKIFLLGGPDEAGELLQLSATYSHCYNTAGVFGLDVEIALMYQLDNMIAMDSFNMHLAALCGTKVVSIWGGTHRYAGFGPLNNNEKNMVEVDHETLECRPCSVFGSTPCYRKDWACLRQITARDVMAKL